MFLAQVAASAGNDNAGFTSFAKVAAPTSGREARKENLQVETEGDSARSPDETIGISNTELATKNTKADPGVYKSEVDAPATPVYEHESSDSEANLVDAVKAFNLHAPTPSLVVNGSGPVESSRKADFVDGFSEDPFQRTDSGSELGTKPPSLDDKSITSGTTFALDEKESLRPDDSASVKAAEDDDTFSGRGSIVAGSRIGSEAAARAYRAQFYEVPDRRNMQPMLERHNQGVITPQSGSSGQQATDDIKPKPLAGAASPDTFNLFYRQTPDEKLLEALESPKDRIFLLRLEQDVIEFVKDSK